MGSSCLLLGRLLLHISIVKTTTTTTTEAHFYHAQLYVAHAFETFDLFGVRPFINFIILNISEMANSDFHVNTATSAILFSISMCTAEVYYFF